MATRRGKRALGPRHEPVQQRSRERQEAILAATSRVLAETGIDGLTTVRIAADVGISVGSLYHFYPNKHAILYALGARWVDRLRDTLAGLAAEDVESLGVDEFCKLAVMRLFDCYRSERAMLPLAQALWTLPELRELDTRHDALVIDVIGSILRRLDFRASDNELDRISRAWLELTHALLLVAISQRGQRQRRTLVDLELMAGTLLRAHAGDTRSATRDVGPP